MQELKKIENENKLKKQELLKEIRKILLEMKPYNYMAWYIHEALNRYLYKKISISKLALIMWKYGFTLSDYDNVKNRKDQKKIEQLHLELHTKLNDLYYNY